ncbi:uncharacterized protein [Lolium perenne]|uniref:uncharacterized protein isoform X1 n=2 Tax=Lolium perenne TaxID=4522 RepID=UPI0021F57417|nr:uncharacterized protein LOC127300500 isoform X1 [Lolium perenne]
MASSPSSLAKSSSRPQRFPENLFVLDNPRPEDKLTPQIFLAAGDGNIRSMKKLAEGLAREGKSLGEMTVNDPLHRRLGPLHFAAWSGKLEMCRFLIKDLHLDVNADADRGSSPLLFAACGRAPKEAVRLLLDRGANPNIACGKGYTVLHVVATMTKRDSSGVAEILLSRGANVDPMCELGTPLHYAAECGNVQMLDMLLQYHANPNRVVRLFYAPLTLAIFAHSLKCVELLIKAGADVNAGRPVTPLIIAAADGLADCVKCLLEAGADANIPDEIGRTPLEIAAIQGWKECVEILFPFTSRLTRFPDWSIDGIMQHVALGSSRDYKKCEGSALKAQGDAAFQAKDYPHASDLYTKAVETDPHDSTLYAKRSLCWLHMGEKDKAFNDANTYKGMDVDLSSSCHEQAAALILTKEYGLACKALLSGLKLDFGRGPIGEVSREKNA